MSQRICRINVEERDAKDDMILLTVKRKAFVAVSVHVSVTAPIRFFGGWTTARIRVQRTYREPDNERLFHYERYYRYTPERAARIDAVLNRAERPDVTVRKNREEATSTYFYDCHYKRPPFNMQIALTGEKILISRIMFRTDGARRRVVKVCYRSYTETPRRRAAIMLAAAQRGAIFTPNEWGVMCAVILERWQ